MEGARHGHADEEVGIARQTVSGMSITLDE
jgi:hypothetical protein